MAMAAPAGLVESNIDKDLRYLAEKLDIMFKEVLWGGNEEILREIAEYIFYFHFSIQEDTQILLSRLIPKARLQLDESNDPDEKNNKARFSDFERSLVNFTDINMEVLKKGDPREAIDCIHELFIYLLDTATLLSDEIGLIDYSDSLQQIMIPKWKIDFMNTEYYIERQMKKARP